LAKYINSPPSWDVAQWASTKTDLPTGLKNSNRLPQNLLSYIPRRWEKNRRGFPDDSETGPTIRARIVSASSAAHGLPPTVPNCCTVRSGQRSGGQPSHCHGARDDSGGGESQFHTPHSAKMQVLACVFAQRKRLLPVDFGASAYVITVPNIPEMETASRLWLDAVKFSGLVEVEFKYHTGRPLQAVGCQRPAWGWARLVRFAGWIIVPDVAGGTG